MLEQSVHDGHGIVASSRPASTRVTFCWRLLFLSRVNNKDDFGFSFEMLLPSMMVEDMKEEFEDTLKVSFKNSSSKDFEFVLMIFCLVKS